MSKGQGWSDDTAGPGGLASLVVAELGLGSMNYLRIQTSFYAAWSRMMLDPRWAQIANAEDAKTLMEEYL
jgi:hypothetical protein